jgi:hypothetical protein
MKKRSRPAARKAGKRAKKPIMRHSRESAKPRRARRKRSVRSARAPKPRSRAAKPARKRKRPPTRRRKGSAGAAVESPLDARGLGAEAGGQSGDTEGLSRAELAASESVEELVEEGQAFEAGIVSGVENAPDADRGGVRTREVPEDDVPQEYLDED